MRRFLELDIEWSTIIAGRDWRKDLFPTITIKLLESGMEHALRKASCLKVTRWLRLC
jgi:hypothetical protein